ncbi:MAG: arylsulfatase, partial [Pseudomonadota bacterium]
MHWNSRPITSRIAHFALAFAAAGTLPAIASAQTGEDRPNFLIVVADDMGWSDIGPTGGEIRTPTLDELASQGVTFTNFHVAPTCSPTRAMLMTGLPNHETGVGTQHTQQAPNQLDDIDYGGQLHDGVVTVAEALGSVGYQSMMTGKWHLGFEPDQFPSARGFDQTFILVEGGASHFADRQVISPTEPITYLENGQPVELEPDFYSTITYTDKLLTQLEQRAPGMPFFAYLSYTAPHDPLQVPDDWLDRYAGAYDAGPAAISAARAQRQIELGILPADAPLPIPFGVPPFLPSFKGPWEQRSAADRAADARPMEIYASMIELMDQQIGRVVDYLDREGELENTVILFMSDNGASIATPLAYPGVTKQWLEATFDMSVENMGKPGSTTYMGLEWAQAANTPNALFKVVTAQGGIRSPLIASGPNVPQLGYADQLTFVTDIAATVFEMAGFDPNTAPIYEDKPKPWGVPLAASLAGEKRDPVIVELYGNVAVFDDGMKLSRIDRPFGTTEWALYDLRSDPGETRDLASEQPDVVAEMAASYDAYAEATGVIEPEPRLKRSVRYGYAGPCNWHCEA